MSAVKPDFFKSVPALTETVIGGKVTVEEQALHEMAQTGGWKIFKEHAEQASRELGNMNRQAIAQGMALEDIGRNTVVIALAQEVIERLLNKVADATEACLKNE